MQAKEILKKQIGDIFEIVKPFYLLWNSTGNILFIKFKNYNVGFIEKLKRLNIVFTAEDVGGNNIIKVIIKI